MKMLYRKGHDLTVYVYRKTTLLNVLAQRVNTGVVTGDFLINGRYVCFASRIDYILTVVLADCPKVSREQQGLQSRWTFMSLRQPFANL